MRKNTFFAYWARGFYALVDVDTQLCSVELQHKCWMGKYGVCDDLATIFCELTTISSQVLASNRDHPQKYPDLDGFGLALHDTVALTGI